MTRFKRLAVSALTVALLCPLSAGAQSADNTDDVIDEVIATGTLQTDPAMSAFRSGDYATAEIEFQKNAMCALRVTRNFEAGIESARDSSIRADLGVDTNVAPQPTGGQGGGGISVANAPSIGSVNSVQSNNLKRSEDQSKRTCEDRGFQIYMRGMSELKLGKIDEARESLAQATRLKRTLYDAHFRLALLAYQDGDIKQAKSEFKKLQSIQKKCRRCQAKEEIQGQVTYLNALLPS